MFSGRHFDRSVILLCVRWYLAYNLSLRDLEEMMCRARHSGRSFHDPPLGSALLAAVARAVQPSKATYHRQVAYRRNLCEGSWSVDVSLSRHRQLGDTVEFFLSEHRDLLAAKRFIRRALSAMAGQNAS
jgi:putative transposase